MGLVATSIVAACSYTAPQNTPPGDGGPIPDAGPCQDVGTAECAGNTLRTCTTKDQLPDEQVCGWGCSNETAPHCAKLQPAGNAITEADLDPDAALLPATLDGVTINSDSGEITGVRSAIGFDSLDAGIRFAVNNNVGIFRFKQLTISGPVTVVGNRALALVALDGIEVKDTIDARGDCSGSNAGPGGFAGGGPGSDGLGAGAGLKGTGADDASSGGGGAGHGGNGEDGGDSNNGAQPSGGKGGSATGDAVISVIRGGAGGGGGGGNNPGGGAGGGGGGAVQLASNGPIVFSMATGGINAGGCGGSSGIDKRAAGGGGAGGMIVIEAPTVEFKDTSVLAVNGGGGGGGDNPSEGATDGDDGRFDATRAAGGKSGNKGGDGGNGGADTHPDGSKGKNDQNGGGGGGGVGWIRINTAGGSATVGGNVVLSPPLGEPSSTQGTAIVQ